MAARYTRSDRAKFHRMYNDLMLLINSNFVSPEYICSKLEKAAAEGFPIDYTRGNSASLLEEAASANNVVVVNKLLELDADINAYNILQKIICCPRFFSTEILQTVAQKAQINQINNGHTAAGLCCICYERFLEQRYLDFLRILLNNDADPYIDDVWDRPTDNQAAKKAVAEIKKIISICAAMHEEVASTAVQVYNYEL